MTCTCCTDNSLVVAFPLQDAWSKYYAAGTDPADPTGDKAHAALAQVLLLVFPCYSAPCLLLSSTRRFMRQAQAAGTR